MTTETLLAGLVLGIVNFLLALVVLSTYSEHRLEENRRLAKKRLDSDYQVW